MFSPKIRLQVRIEFKRHYVHQDGEGEKNRYIKGENYPGNYAVLGFQFLI